MNSRRGGGYPEAFEATEAQKALTKLLVKCGLIDPALAGERLVFHEHEPISHYSKLGAFDEEEGIRVVAEKLKIGVHKFTRADRAEITRLMGYDTLSKVGVEMWKKLKAVPVAIEKDQLVLVMANPVDIATVRKLEFDLHYKIKTAIASEKDILSELSGEVSARDGLDFKSLLKTDKDAPEFKTSDIGSPNHESNISNEDITAPTIIKLVNRIFAGAIQKGASDLHISPENDRLAVRVRIDGILRDFIDVPGSYRDAVISRIKVLCGMDITEKRQPQDGRLRLKTSLGERDLRLSTVPTVHGENLVARILAAELDAVKIDNLGMPEDVRKSYERSLSASSRVIIAAGPTGSGKTSTLYAGLKHLKDGSSHIITIEDPIEYRIPGVNQIQVNTKVGMTFAKVLRSILRQDPDVIMVGEIRDSETAATAMQVAQTGHLVLSTLHTNTAAAAIIRLRDLGIPSYQIASSLGSIVAQRLMRCLCPACRKPAEQADHEKLQSFGVQTSELWQAGGCDECDNTGFSGRAGIFSFLEITPQVAAAIREEKSEPEIEKLARVNGFKTLDEAGLDLVCAGQSSLEEMERVLGPLELLRSGRENSVPFMEVPPPAAAAGQENILIPKRRILIVDDDETVRTVYNMVLQYEMFDVLEASDGLEALNKIYENPPELVMCDLMMPKMGGLEMLERMRQDPRTKNIPVLMLTAAASDENELKLMKSGADDFISKTARSEIIVARINRLLNR